MASKPKPRPGKKIAKRAKTGSRKPKTPAVKAAAPNEQPPPAPPFESKIPYSSLNKGVEAAITGMDLRELPTHLDDADAMRDIEMARPPSQLEKTFWQRIKDTLRWRSE